MQRTARILIALLLVGLIVPFVSVQRVRAATVTATSFTDRADGACATTGTGDCTLREAVIFGNAHPDTTISLLAGTYLLTLGLTSTTDAPTDSSRGSLFLTNADGMTTIVGAGAAATIIDGGGMAPVRDRIFAVGPYPSGTVTATIAAVTIRNGYYVGGGAPGSEGGSGGGGIYTSETGNLTVQNSVISGNRTLGSHGGGLYTRGFVALIGTTVSGNQIPAPVEGFGGGIDADGQYNRLTLTDCIVTNNQAYQGGGIDLAGSPLMVTRTTITDNRSRTDGGGMFIWSEVSLRESTVSNNVAAGNGGGIETYGDHADVSNSTVSGNIANTAGMQAGTEDGGGGIYNSAGYLTITGSTIDGNTAGYGGGIFTLTDHGEAVSLTSSTVSSNHAHYGGGIFNSGNVILLTSTLSGNTADGDSSSGYGAYGGDGGAIFNLDDGNAGSGQESLTGVTIVGGGSGITHGAPPNPAYYNPSPGKTTLKNSLLANGGGDCAGAQSYLGTDLIVSGNDNLSNDASCRHDLTQPHDLTGVNPLLGQLADNGGPTRTHALLIGSPAIDAGGTSANGCSATDQRGVARPQGAACDIGAYEFVPLAPLPPLPSPKPVATLPGSPQPIAAPRPTGPALGVPNPLPASRP